MSIPSPSERFLAASIASNLRWALEPDRSKATAPGRAAFDKRFEDQVDPDRTMLPEERAKRVANARKAYFHALALKSARSRARKRDTAA